MWAPRGFTWPLHPSGLLRSQGQRLGCVPHVHLPPHPPPAVVGRSWSLHFSPALGTNGNKFQGPGILSCSPQPTALSRLKEFHGHIWFFLLEPIMFTRQSAVGVELGWPLWALNPPPHPQGAGWGFYSQWTPGREARSRGAPERIVMQSPPETESFCHSIMFTPCDPSTQLDREPRWGWGLSGAGTLHLPGTGSCGPAFPVWLSSGPEALLRGHVLGSSARSQLSDDISFTCPVSQNKLVSSKSDQFMLLCTGSNNTLEIVFVIFGETS